jgi:hypothetical protein
MKPLTPTLPLGIATAALFVLGACTATSSGNVGAVTQAVTATCVDNAAQIPAGALRCGETRTVECTAPGGTDPGPIYGTPVPLVDGGASPVCADTIFVTDHALPLPLGATTVVVSESAEAGSAPVCSATITVKDTTPPRATSKDQTLWPPNHTMTKLNAADCVTATDTCDPSVILSFTYASADEAPNSTGDGNTSPDVNVLACDAVEVRAERQGNADGRVYRLGWKATDTSGNATTGECKVTVPHDQGAKGAAVAGPEVYRVAFPPCK